MLNCAIYAKSSVIFGYLLFTNRVSPYIHENNVIFKIDFSFISNLNFLQSYRCEFKLIICTHVEKIQTGSLTWEKIKVKDLSTEKETQGRMREIRSIPLFKFKMFVMQTCWILFTKYWDDFKQKCYWNWLKHSNILISFIFFLILFIFLYSKCIQMAILSRD